MKWSIGLPIVYRKLISFNLFLTFLLWGVSDDKNFHYVQRWFRYCSEFRYWKGLLHIFGFQSLQVYTFFFNKKVVYKKVVLNMLKTKESSILDSLNLRKFCFIFSLLMVCMLFSFFCSVDHLAIIESYDYFQWKTWYSCNVCNAFNCAFAGQKKVLVLKTWNI